jgi:hypothetical protein
MALQNKWTVVNEVRDLEDLGPVDWGEEPATGEAPKVTIDDK